MRRSFLVLALLLALASGVVAQEGFSVDTISDALFARMKGKSFPTGCTVARNELRHVSLLHYNLKGEVQQGELVCNRAIANDLLDIFRELFRRHYPIESVRLIDDFDADDERSMQANNTSCFCFRTVDGSKKLSKHALGMAIDVNPLYNPCVKGGRVSPANGAKYARRNRSFPCKIDQQDLCYRLFRQHGFTWGGSWRSLKDYQHFEK
jgi:hypothetical protein